VCPVLAYNACKRRPRGSFRGGRADGSQIWFRFARDHRWRPSRSADTARDHGRASRGEKRQRSSGHRSESVLPVCRLLSPNPLDVWGRQGARRSARTRTSGDRRAPLAGGRHPPPRADRTAVREALGSLQDGVWCRARLSWALPLTPGVRHCRRRCRPARWTSAGAAVAELVPGDALRVPIEAVSALHLARPVPRSRGWKGDRRSGRIGFPGAC